MTDDGAIALPEAVLDQPFPNPLEARSVPPGGNGSGEHGVLHLRNRRILVAAVAAYVVVLSALMIGSGVSLTPDVVLVGLGLVAVLLGRGRLFARDWVPFIGLFLAYELMRGYADDLGGKVHVTDILGLERAIFGGALPTEVLQRLLHPVTGVDPWAIAGTVFYFLHFPLPLAVGFALWVWRRRLYYDFVAALIILAMAGFVTYLLLPVAPPWWAAERGFIPGPDGTAAIQYLKPQGFADLARFFGFEGRYVYSYAVYEINPNPVAAFPSLHAGFPFLAFLFARRSFGRLGWPMLLYAAGVWFSIVYLGDHYVVDVIGGLVYAGAAYSAVVHAPGWFRRVMDRATDAQLDADPATEPGPAGHRTGSVPGRRIGAVRWTLVRQGALLVLIGSIGIVGIAQGGWFGGDDQPVFLLPWAVVLGGLWRGALGLVSR